MKNIFQQTQLRKPPTNTFDLSHDKKMSCKMGRLIPILCAEVLPGDKFNINTSQLLRFSPLTAPVMHQINVYTHYFYVPNRILWDGWEDFITGGEDGMDATVWPFVSIDISAASLGSNLDYFGIPVTEGGAYNTEISALPFAAYNKIYNEYYRDQNLITAIYDTLIDGDNTDAAFLSQIGGEPYPRAWQHDYFTSCLPWIQKGPQATIPLGTTAPIDWIPNGLVGSTLYQSDGSDTIVGDGINMESHQSGGVTFINPGVTLSENMRVNVSLDHQVDLSSATAATITDLRRSIKLQEWMERNARGGSRYTESILSHFGVRSSDARLQRPEFLGGSTSPVQISEVLQQSANTSEPTPQGNMAGHGISVGSGKTISYKAEEHGLIIGLMSIMPKTAYQQGMHKMFSKANKFEYYWPSFAHIGEMPVQMYEIYLQAVNLDNWDTFGYIPNYADYKFLPSTVHGEFRDSLDHWHWGRKFASTPALNQTFIECIPRTDQFAVTEDEHMYVHIYHDIKATRLMPYFGSPSL